jgi:membrane fusion protein (multidrug efflux system)
MAISQPALAQQPSAKPPAVGVVTATLSRVTQSNEYVGRIQATDRVNIVARVDAYLDQRLFTEGAEVKKGDLLYRLEQGPFTADVQAKQAAMRSSKPNSKMPTSRCTVPGRCSIQWQGSNPTSIPPSPPTMP